MRANERASVAALYGKKFDVCVESGIVEPRLGQSLHRTFDYRSAFWASAERTGICFAFHTPQRACH